LLGSFVILSGTTLISASMMYLVERQAQPERFGTIPDAMWWAIVTLGTVGYGDAVPITPAGKLVAGVTILFGLMMVALPVGIIATAFANEIRRRDFVVTWGMVARFPLFGALSAIEIADVIRLLKAQTFERGDVIIRRGEEGHSMYFIAAGEVEIQLPKENVRLSSGEFFGEVAVLKRAKRSATAIALVRTNLLVLEAHDLHALMERDPRIAEHVRAAARQRGGEV
jgi:voltage-gated potassium channel